VPAVPGQQTSRAKQPRRPPRDELVKRGI
jgi:hypothetical protein